MVWPFRSKVEDAGVIAGLRRELEDAWESYSCASSARSTAETAMQAMQKAMTEEGIADIALAVTAQIADIYASGGHSVKTRDIQVHAVVANAVRMATMGEPHWNEGRLAAKAQEACKCG